MHTTLGPLAPIVFGVHLKRDIRLAFTIPPDESKRPINQESGKSGLL